MKETITEKLSEPRSTDTLNGNALAAIVQVEAALLKGARAYFDKEGFTEVVVPHITKATGSCENINTLFETDYFGQTAYLVQTGQLYLEAIIPKLGNVYCIGPSFRAEPSVDDRHLTEFTLVEIEFPGDFEQLLAHIEGTLGSMFSTAKIEAEHALDYLGVGTEHLKKKPFNRITYTQAVEELKNHGVQWGDDLKSAHEHYLVKQHGNIPLFITHYPEAIKFFNMRENEQNHSVVNSADLILPYGGEAVGSAEREYKHERLQKRLANSVMMKQLESRGGSITDFDWYMDLVKQHGKLHAGCGIGLNRVTQYVLQSSDIRATTAYAMNKETLM